MKSILDSYIVAFLILIVGIAYIKMSLNRRKKGDIDWTSPWQEYLNGWAVGIGCVFIFVVIVLCKIGLIKN